jgi:3-hydroxybutyryl-CoA dehydrogenase
MLSISKRLFSTVKSFGVIGSGQMGTGIAIVANRIAKLPVTIFDSNQVAVRKSEDFVKGWLEKELSKNKITN